MADKSIIEGLRAQIDEIVSGDVENNCEDFPRYDIADKGNTTSEDAYPSSSETSDIKCADAALKKIIALVNASDKSELAIRERLNRDCYSQDAIDEAVQSAKRYGLIDDDRFASILIRSRISQGRGSVGICRELADNGIEADDVPGWPYEFPLSYDEELDRAICLLDRKPPHSKNMRESAYRKLVQKGYPSSVASSAARMWFERSIEA